MKSKSRLEWLELLQRCQNGEATCLFVLNAIEAEQNVLFDALKDANGLCRSMNSIASRKGESTYWDGFQLQLDKQLKVQHDIMYPTETYER